MTEQTSYVGRIEEQNAPKTEAVKAAEAAVAAVGSEPACRFPVISRCSHGCGEHNWSNAALCDVGLAALRRQLEALQADQQDWRNGVALIASALGERNPKDLSCVRISENALSIRAKVEEQRVHMEAWYTVFGTTQLTHAQASLDAWNAEHKRLLIRLDDQARVIAGLREALQAISEGKGRFSRDPFEHCRNTVEDMKALAIAVLSTEPKPPHAT